MIVGRVLVVGTTAIDFNVSVPYIPEGGNAVLGKGGYSMSVGGRGANIAIAVSRLGWTSVLCSAIGNDLFGRTFSNIFRDEKVDTSNVRMSKSLKTGVNLILSQDNGKDGKVVVEGAYGQIGAAEVEASFNNLPDGVVASLDLSIAAVAQASHDAKLQNALFVLDTYGASWGTPIEEIKSADVIITTDAQLSDLTGVRIKGVDDRLSACIRLSSKISYKYLLINLGDNGTYIYDGKYHSCVMPVDAETVDCKGSEEAFISAFIVEYLRSSGLDNAVAYASAAKACAGAAVGSFESLPTGREITELLSKY